MSTFMIFALGAFVTLITVAAVVLVGLLEAADPDHSRPEDLTEWEWALVKDARERRTKKPDELTSAQPRADEPAPAQPRADERR